MKTDHFWLRHGQKRQETHEIWCQNEGVPLLGVAPLMENLRYFIESHHEMCLFSQFVMEEGTTQQNTLYICSVNE